MLLELLDHPSWGVRLALDIPGVAGRVPTLLPFAGHFWQAEVPDRGAGVLLAFLDSVPDVG